MEAQEFGANLRKQREEAGLSLDDIEQGTAIRTGFIQSIEEGMFDRVITPLHARGFTVQYANFLGLDGEKMVEESPHLFPIAAAQKFDYGIGTIESRSEASQGMRISYNVGSILGSVALLLVTYWLAHLLDLV